jgi:predicted small lipoprotein YifL
MTRHTLFRVAAMAAVVAGVAGCGKMGDLERPGPLFGRNATSGPGDEAARQAQDPTRPVSTIDPRDRTADPAPPRTIPIPGMANDPNQLPPQGALPNPFANPRR